MTGVVKGLIIGLFFTVGILIGGLTFTSNSVSLYGVSDPSNVTSSRLNRTWTYLGSINTTASAIENQTTSEGAIKNVETTWLGIFFSNLGSVIKTTFDIIPTFTYIFQDLQENNIAGLELGWFIGIIFSIISITLALMVIAWITGRSSDDT